MSKMFQTINSNFFFFFFFFKKYTNSLILFSSSKDCCGCFLFLIDPFDLHFSFIDNVSIFLQFYPSSYFFFPFLKKKTKKNLSNRIDKIANSMCKSSCGFILENPAIFNPLDSLFLLSSRVQIYLS